MLFVKSRRNPPVINEKNLLSFLAGLFVATATLTVLLIVTLAVQAFADPLMAVENPIPVAGGGLSSGHAPQPGGSQPTPNPPAIPGVPFAPLPRAPIPTHEPQRALALAPSAASTATPLPSATPTVFPTPLPWDGSGRVNVLVLGVDHRDWTTEADIPRSDSMILLTIDPQRRTAGMLSIPRDLYIHIPGMGEYKINTAYRWGEMYDLPGGGPVTAMRTVGKLMGVPIDYYVLFDFNSFVKFIDHLGGLDMHIREEIVVDPVGPGNTVTLEPGVQTLSGAEVLGYARNRHTELDDFDRSTRQQEVIMAIREQVLTFNMLPELIVKAPRLASDLSSGIETNLSVDQLVRLAWAARQVPEENIRRSVFDPHNDFIFETINTPEGKQAILRLRPGRIELIRKEFFNQ